IETRRRDVAAAVAAVVRKMMAKKREDRYQTPGEAARALGVLLNRSGEAERTEIPSTAPSDDRNAGVPLVVRSTDGKEGEDARPGAITVAYEEVSVEVQPISVYVPEPEIVAESQRHSHILVTTAMQH